MIIGLRFFAVVFYLLLVSGSSDSAQVRKFKPNPKRSYSNVQPSTVDISPELSGYFSFPTVNYLVSHPATDRVAWVQATQGVPNIFIAQGPSYNSVQCTTYTLDSGLFINTLIFSPDGQTIYFNAQQSDNSNPLFEDYPPTGNVTSIDFSCNPSLTRVLNEGNPSLAAASSGGATWIDQSGQSVYETNQEFQINFLFKVQGDQGYIGDTIWSPSGNSLAFTSYRGDHSFVGIYRRNTTTIQWLNPSFDQDWSPVWSPDEKHVAYYRFYTPTDAGGRPDNTDFEVWITEVSTGESWVVFADDTVGYPITYGFGVRALSWVDDVNVIFPCETSMWLHVCLANINTEGVYTELVTGECEVQDYINYNNSVYVSHNCDNIDTLSIAQIDYVTGINTSLYAVNLHIIGGMADNGYGMAPVASGLIYSRSSYLASGQVVFWEAENLENRMINNLSKSFNSTGFVVPELVTYTSLDNEFTIHAQLFLPSNVRSDNPAVIFTHGGPMRQMYLGFHYCIDYAQLYALNQYLAANGYVVLSINYRMGVGYGKSFRDCNGCGMFGAAEYQDVLAGNLWLQAQNYINSAKIGIHGLSYGGLNCLQALSRNSDMFAAGVANAPVFNWLTESRFDGDIFSVYNPIMYNQALSVGPEPNLATPSWPTMVDANMELMYSSSPASFIANFSSPVLVIQGDSDRNVDVQESIGLIRALRSRGGVQVASMMFPNERHGLSLYSNDLIAAQATFDFLDIQLQT